MLRTSGVKVLFLSSGLFVAGCGGGGVKPIPPVPPVTPMSATIAAPLDGMKTGSLPITVSIKLGGGATAKDVAVAVGGVDVSASFTTDANGNLQAQLTSTQVYVGSNRLTATIPGSSNSSADATSSKATFIYDPTLAPGAEAESFPTQLPDVIPIQTRVLYNGTNWGIQVGNTAYPSNPAITDGFQVLKLNRQTLAALSNVTYAVNGDQDVINLSVQAGPSSSNGGCGYGGCLEIVQSLGSPGYNPCGQSPNCSYYKNTFSNVGGTMTISQIPSYDSSIGYSFVGNVGTDILHVGTQDERITCASTNCGGSFPVPDSATVSNPGIAPNGQGVDVMPTLNTTGLSTCTQTTASSLMPQVTYCLNGNIGGSLVLGSDNSYTFTYSDPPIRFAMTVAPDNPNKSLLTLGATGSFPGVMLESAALPANPDGSPVGGFHLVVMDATTFQYVANNTYAVNNQSCKAVDPVTSNYCQGPDGTNIFELDQLYKDIRSYNSRRYIFFLHSIGNLNHNYGTFGTSSNAPYWAQDIWDRDAQAVQDLGGTWVTFDALNNNAYSQDPYDQYSNQTVPQDDYNMVGQWWINSSGVANPYAAEESTQMSRQTINLPTPPVSNMYGVLKKERDGYYRVTSHSLSPHLNAQQILDYASASVIPQTPWPISTSSTGGTLAAYTWISNQLLGCVTSCGDIHAAYANLNVSPNSWQGLLAQLQPTTDGGDGFTPVEFQQVRGQLSLEFQYLAALRSYQSNLQNLLQAEQANVSIILQQVLDSIDGTIPVDARGGSTSYGIESWRTDVDDGLNIIGALGSFAGLTGTVGQVGSDSADTVIALAEFGIDASASHTVDAKGRTLEELAQTAYATSEIAQKKVQEFAQILTTNGLDFGRISQDWGRLQRVGIPLINNDIVWTASAYGPLLNTFDTATARSLYRAIMPAAFSINQYRWASPGLHNQSGLQPQMYNGSNGECKYYEFMNNMIQNQTSPNSTYTYYGFALWPGAPIDGLSTPLQSAANTQTYNTWWDLWTLNFTNVSNGSNISCTNESYQPTYGFFSASGILDPLDPTDPSRLGMYKPWLFQRSRIPVYQQNDPQFAANFWLYQQNAPLQWGGGPFAPDPTNY